MSLTSAIAARMPQRLLGVLVRAVYPRTEPELARLAEFVPPGGTAIDVGGWFGPWTQRLRHRADLLVAIEAHPALHALLRDAFPDVRVVHAACSDADGEIELWVPENGGALAGTSSVEARRGRPVKVPRITIDGLDLTGVRFIKLDIEGHELAALRGGERTIRRDRPTLLVELEERHRPVAPLVELLASWGYTGHVLPGRTWLPLGSFPLVEHQRENLHRVEQSFIRHLIRPRPRYINSVLFRPDHCDQQVPG